MGMESLYLNKTKEKNRTSSNTTYKNVTKTILLCEEATFGKIVFIVVFKCTVIKAYIRGCMRERTPFFHPSAPASE